MSRAACLWFSCPPGHKSSSSTYRCVSVPIIFIRSLSTEFPLILLYFFYGFRICGGPCIGHCIIIIHFGHWPVNQKCDDNRFMKRFVFADNFVCSTVAFLLFFVLSLSKFEYFYVTHRFLWPDRLLISFFFSLSAGSLEVFKKPPRMAPMWGA